MPDHARIPSSPSLAVVRAREVIYLRNGGITLEKGVGTGCGDPSRLPFFHGIVRVVGVGITEAVVELKGNGGFAGAGDAAQSEGLWGGSFGVEEEGLEVGENDGAAEEAGVVGVWDRIIGRGKKGFKDF